LSCALIDLDRFKSINDTSGHGCGDAALRETAAVLLKSMRGCDIVCRFGGDEFLIILPHTSAAAAQEAIERCRIAVAAHTFMGTGAIKSLTISAGIAELTPDLTSVDHLLSQADEGLYAAKRAGKNAVARSA